MKWKLQNFTQKHSTANFTDMFSHAVRNKQGQQAEYTIVRRYYCMINIWSIFMLKNNQWLTHVFLILIAMYLYSTYGHTYNFHIIVAFMIDFQSRKALAAWRSVKRKFRQHWRGPEMYINTCGYYIQSKKWELLLKAE